MARPARPPLRLAVFGLGNPLLGDDAVGPAVARRVAARPLPADVRVRDLGTPGLDLTPYLLDVDAVLFLDAVRLDEAPGAMRLIGRDELLRLELSPRVSAHDPGVQQALQIVELCQGRRIDVSVLAIQPAGVEVGAPLSPQVEAVLPRAEEAVLRWLADRGVAIPASPRREPEQMRS